MANVLITCLVLFVFWRQEVSLEVTSSTCFVSLIVFLCLLFFLWYFIWLWASASDWDISESGAVFFSFPFIIKREALFLSTHSYFCSFHPWACLMSSLCKPFNIIKNHFTQDLTVSVILNNHLFWFQVTTLCCPHIEEGKRQWLEMKRSIMVWK